jgi:anaerobic magnesium-protoporphyrin IX monomethyl ester cyclase
MRLLFLQPPLRDFYRTQFREYPLGLLSIAAAAERAGHEVALLDARRCARPARIPVPPKLQQLEKIYTKENDLFLNYKHFGISAQEICSQAVRLRPDAILVSSLFTPYVGEVIEAAQALKSALPSCPIIAGGHHATADPASLLESNAIDLVVRGEGELAIAALDARGIWPTIDRPASSIAELDAFSFPARHLIDPDHYRYGGRRYTMILTSRGCPHRCSFCSVHALCDGGYRTRSIDAVIAEIGECIERHDIGAFDLQDDALLANPTRIKELFEEIARRYEGRNLEWMATNGLNPAGLDDELLTLMKRIGFRKLDLSLGTGDVPSRTNLKRPETIEHYERALAAALRLCLPVTTYVILGMPTQPYAHQRATIEYLFTKDTLVSPSVFYNVPGMPQFEEFRRFEYVDAHIARRSSAFNTFGVDFTRDDIVDLVLAVRRRNLDRKA